MLISQHSCRFVLPVSYQLKLMRLWYRHYCVTTLLLVSRLMFCKGSLNSHCSEPAKPNSRHILSWHTTERNTWWEITFWVSYDQTISLPSLFAWKLQNVSLQNYMSIMNNCQDNFWKLKQMTNIQTQLWLLPFSGPLPLLSTFLVCTFCRTSWMNIEYQSKYSMNTTRNQVTTFANEKLCTDICTDIHSDAHREKG